MRFLALLCAAASLFCQELKEARVPFAGQELVYLYGEQEAPSKPLPLLIFLHENVGGEIDVAQAVWKQWFPIAAAREWRLIVPWTGSTGPAWTDSGVKALEAIVLDAKNRFRVDEKRVYLAGRGDAAAQVFYTVSRMPDLWAAGLAIEGSPKAAIDSNRLYGANTSLVPVMWVLQNRELPVMQPLREKLADQKFNVAVRTAEGFTVGDTLDWLAKHTRQLFPPMIDCETGSAAFARCYWLEMIKFDPSLQNDVLGSTRVPPGSGAYLDLGGFGFNLSAPGPGILVTWLPENYQGPLQLEDRIVSLGGRTISDAEDYVDIMDDVKEAKNVAIIIERRGKRRRLETRILLPVRQEFVTVRAQAEYLPQFEEIQVLSRGIAAMRLEVAAHWVPCSINWNGVEVVNTETGGCWRLTSGADATPCRQ